MRGLTRFWDWVDQRLIVRRSVLALTLWSTLQAFWWAAAFAETSTRDGVELAAVIVAVVAPITYLQKIVFEQYQLSRGDK